jgi:hypothetical protein
MGHIEWKSFFLGILAYWAYKYLSVAFAAKIG